MYKGQPLTDITQRFPCSAGFSIVEVLVSVMVLTIGMLGMVGMQASSLQANRDARLQSIAAFQARELADLMRGNPTESSKTLSNPYFVSTSSKPLKHTNPDYCLNVAATTACTNPINVANAQMTEWLARVDDELPGARVVVCMDSVPFDASGLATWSCTAGAGASMVIKIGWSRASTNKSLTGSQALDRATVPSIVFPV